MLVSDDIENPRLKALEMTSDGFEIAEMDYSLRGPGDYLGLNQSGFNSLEYASFSDDIKILECARDDSSMLINKYISGEIKSKKFDYLIEREIEIDKIN